MSTRRVKRQGTIDPPQDVINIKREKVFVEGLINNTIRKKTMIITTYETINTIVIYIGNRDIYCMDVQLLKDTLNTITTGYLTKARWDISCSIGEPFEKGSDTIIMIKLLVTYIKDNYPHILQLLFNDMSTKSCNDNSSVSLAAMKLLTDGQTWYETHFDTSMDILNKYIYTTIKENITKKKRELSFDVFSIYSNINILQIPNNTLRQLYNTSNNWQDFFSNIRDIIGISQFCIWLSNHNWLDIFVHTILKINISTLQFALNIKKYDEIQYNIVNNTGGKYRTTKKKSTN